MQEDARIVLNGIWSKGLKNIIDTVENILLADNDNWVSEVRALIRKQQCFRRFQSTAKGGVKYSTYLCAYP